MNTAASQHGLAAVLWLWLLLGISSSFIMLLPQVTSPPDQRMHNHAVLTQAKQALLQYAASSNERKPGRYLILPCPDSHSRGLWDVGISHGSCGSRHRPAMGWLPWRTLGMPPLQDAAGECLWYVVSGAVKSNPVPWLANTDTEGDLRVYKDAGMVELTGSEPRQRALAVLIAPGKPLPGQRRARSDGICGSDDATDYMEKMAAFDNSAAGFSWLHSYNHNDINDYLAFITAEELQQVVTARDDMWAQLAAADTHTDSLLLRLAQCLAEYAAVTGMLPWPATQQLHELRADSSYDDYPGINFGRLPNTVDDSNDVAGLDRRRLVLNCGHFTDSKWKRLWQNWKDHIFYAVATAWQPGAGDDISCAAGCLAYGHVGGYAAIVWFAGKRLAEQQRHDTAILHDWLESAEPWPARDNGGASYPLGNGNDSVLCITTTLLVQACATDAI